MRSRGGPPPTSEGVAASLPRHLPLQGPKSPSSLPSSLPGALKGHADRDARILQGYPTLGLAAAFRVWRSPTGAFYFPTHNSTLRPEAPKFEPPSSLSADAWCFTPPLVDVTSVLSTILEGDEWAEDAGWQVGTKRIGTKKILKPAASPLGGSSTGDTTRAGCRTGAPACGRGPLVASACPSTTAYPDTNSMTRDVSGAPAYGKDPAGAPKHPGASVTEQERAGTEGDCREQPTEASLQRMRTSPRRSGSRGPRRGLPRKAPVSSAKFRKPPAQRPCYSG